MKGERCVPVALDAMGLHYVNFPLVLDGVLDPTRPEIVIYEPLPNGRLRLIGADYLVLASDWDSKNPAPPELMGQLLHLFESPNRFGLPTFYTVHVWAWKENPTGSPPGACSTAGCSAGGPCEHRGDGSSAGRSFTSRTFPRADRGNPC